MAMTKWSTGAIAALLLSGAAVAAAGEQTGTEEPAPAQRRAQLVMPQVDPTRGRELFVAKGCVACHAINEIGGTSAPPLDAETVPDVIDPFDFVARMWRGAEAMIFMQEQALGEPLDFTGEELADIIAFVYDPEEQRRFSDADVPPEYRRRIRSD
jgi:cytochrome c